MTATTAPRTRTVESARPTDQSIGELLAATTHDLQELFRLEIELAKTELQENARTAAQAGTFFGAGGLLAYLALALLCFAAAWGLDAVLPTGVAFLIVGLVIALAATVCMLTGRTRLQAFNAVPEQTVATIKEDVQWAEQLRN